MKIRDAELSDIEALSELRLSVKENSLSNPGLVNLKDYEDFLSIRGKGWVCEKHREILGFAVVDLQDDNVWALFVRPGYERRGIGRWLHEVMLDWYFEQGKERIWLSTAPGTRAEGFYRAAGWRHTGTTKSEEVKFEMTVGDWMKI